MLATGAGTGLATAQTATPGEQAPYDGPHEVPCLIPAVHFDRGGEGVAYHEASPEESYGDYREEAVDHQRSPEGGYNIGWIEAGEWWEYTVQVPETDSYRLSLRIAATTPEPGITVTVDGEEVEQTPVVWGPVETWQSWKTNHYGGVREFDAGEHVIRVRADTGDWNFKWLEVGESGAEVPGVDMSPSDLDVAAVARSRTSVTLDWEFGGPVEPNSRTFELSGDGTVAAATGEPPLTIDGLEPDTEYTIREPWNATGQTVTTAARADDHSPLPPPDLTVEAEQTPRIDVTWERARDVGGAGVHHYAVYLDGELVHTRDARATSASLTDSLAQGRTYEVGVAAVDAAGNESDRRTATVSTGPSKPTGVPSKAENLRVTERGPTELTFEWDEFSEDDLDRVELRWEDARSGEALPPADERTTGSYTMDGHVEEYSLDGLPSGVPYRFEVRPVDVDGQAPEWTSVEVRTPPAPTNPRIAGMDLPSLTVAWDRPYDDWDGFDLTEYEVAVEDGPTLTVDPTVDSVTIDEFPTDGHREVAIAGIDAEGERTATATILPTIDPADGASGDRTVDPPATYLGADVGDYVAAWLRGMQRGYQSGQSSITVEDGTVWIRGEITTSFGDDPVVAVHEATFDGDTLHVTVGADGGDESGFGPVDYQVGLGVDRRPSDVVVHHLGTPSATSWSGGDSDGAVVPVTNQRDVPAHNDVRGAIVLTDWTGGVSSGRIEVTVDESLVEMDVDSFPDDVDGTVERDGDAAVLTFDAPADEDAVDGFGDEVLPEEFPYETGTVLGRFSVRGSEPGVAAVDVTTASLTAPSGGELDLETASTEVRIAPSFEVAGENPADLDRDGLYEDLNANGEGDLADAVTLYQERNRGAVRDHYRYVDFSGNGEVDLADVVQLFQENAD